MESSKLELSLFSQQISGWISRNFEKSLVPGISKYKENIVFKDLKNPIEILDQLIGTEGNFTETIYEMINKEISIEILLYYLNAALQFNRDSFNKALDHLYFITKNNDLINFLKFINRHFDDHAFILNGDHGLKDFYKFNYGSINAKLNDKDDNKIKEYKNIIKDFVKYFVLEFVTKLKKSHKNIDYQLIIALDINALDKNTSWRREETFSLPQEEITTEVMQIDEFEWIDIFVSENNSEFHKKIKELKQLNKELNKKINFLNQSFEKKNTDYKNEIQKLETTIQEYKKDNAALYKYKENYEKQIKEFHILNEKKRDEFTRVHKHLLNAELERNKFKAQYNSQCNENAKLKAKISLYEDPENSITQELKQYKERNNEQQAEINRLKLMNKHHEENLDELMKTNSMTIKHLENDNLKLDSLNKEIQAKYTEQQAEINRLTSLNKKLYKDLEEKNHTYQDSNIENLNKINDLELTKAINEKQISDIQLILNINSENLIAQIYRIEDLIKMEKIWIYIKISVLTILSCFLLPLIHYCYNNDFTLYGKYKLFTSRSEEMKNQLVEIAKYKQPNN